MACRTYGRKSKGVCAGMGGYGARSMRPRSLTRLCAREAAPPPRHQLRERLTRFGLIDLSTRKPRPHEPPFCPPPFSSTAAEGKGEPEDPNTCCAISYSNAKAEATV